MVDRINVSIVITAMFPLAASISSRQPVWF